MQACNADASNCESGDCGAEDTSRPMPNCAAKNLRCKCTQCAAGFYASDCSKKCPVAIVAVTVDSVFSGVGMWLFLGGLFYNFKHEDKESTSAAANTTSPAENRPWLHPHAT